MILIGCLVTELRISFWVAAVTAVKFGLPAVGGGGDSKQKSWRL